MKRWYFLPIILIVLLAPMVYHLTWDWGEDRDPRLSGPTSLTRFDDGLPTGVTSAHLETTPLLLGFTGGQGDVLMIAGLDLPPDDELIAILAGFLAADGTILLLEDHGAGTALLPAIIGDASVLAFDPHPIFSESNAGDTSRPTVPWIDAGINHTLVFDDPAGLLLDPEVEVLIRTNALSFSDRDGDGLLDTGEEGSFALIVETTIAGGRLIVIGDRDFLADERPDANREFVYDLLAEESPDRIIYYGVDRGPQVQSSLLRTAGLGIEMVALGTAWYFLFNILIATLVIILLVPLPTRFLHHHSLEGSRFPTPHEPGADRLRGLIRAKISLYHNIPVAEFDNLDPERQRLFVPDDEVWAFLVDRSNPPRDRLAFLARRVRRW